MSDHIIIIQNSVNVTIISSNATSYIRCIIINQVFDFLYYYFWYLLSKIYWFDWKRIFIFRYWTMNDFLHFGSQACRKIGCPRGMCLVCLTVDHLIEPKWIKCKKTHGELSDIVSHFKLWLILSLKMSSRLKKGDFWFP